MEVMRPSDVLLSINPRDAATPPIWSEETTAPLSIPITGKDEDRSPEFQRSKAMFFFKLERELEKVWPLDFASIVNEFMKTPCQINAFYLQKEEQLKLRLTNLQSKRRAATQRLQADADEISPDIGGAEWRAVDEGFRSLEKDLGKLQVSALITFYTHRLT